MLGLIMNRQLTITSLMEHLPTTADDRKRPAKRSRSCLQCVTKIRRHDHAVRRRRDVQQRAVKIEEQQCHLLVLARCPRRCLIEAVQQQSAIRQAGELVVMCKPARLRHRLCELSHFLLQKFISFLERVDLTQRRYYLLLAGRERAVEFRCIRER